MSNVILIQGHNHCVQHVVYTPHTQICIYTHTRKHSIDDTSLTLFPMCILFHIELMFGVCVGGWGSEVYMKAQNNALNI